MNLTFDGYLVTDDKNKMVFNDIVSLIRTSYWAKQRSEEVIQNSINHSLCYAVLKDDKQVAFARVVTDYSTMYWLCDVLVDESVRGLGLGKKMVEVLTTDPRLAGLLGVLATKDAHGLYEQYGFHKEANKFMKKPRKAE